MTYNQIFTPYLVKKINQSFDVFKNDTYNRYAVQHGLREYLRKRFNNSTTIWNAIVDEFLEGHDHKEILFKEFRIVGPQMRFRLTKQSLVNIYQRIIKQGLEQ